MRVATSRRRALLTTLATSGAVLVLGGAPAGAEPGEAWAEGGVEACIKCHDVKDKYPVLAILQTQHAVKGDSRTPLAQEHGCQTCHGPSADHMKEPAEGQERAPVPITFDSDTPAREQTEVCLTCHTGSTRMDWAGSIHEMRDVTCTSCHVMHTAEDPVMVKNIRPDDIKRDGQSDVCFTCHKQERAQIWRLSSHPLAEGKMECSDCHNPHGSTTTYQLNKPTLNETCYTCHAEKRGPFLYEHPPAREDCTNCHTPHGSNHPPLLKARTHMLCQECHSASFHPSTGYAGDNIPEYHISARSCLNCHQSVHGSNHPSGVRWTR